ncbi:MULTISPECIES: hypothetical protein [Arcobacteraceae]|uniref:Uncharacterized protein n=1 Tax=Poseidonibacter parvus TaxID=1850254 RepID=A0A1P8KMZ1_9BACT|nr:MULTISPECIES: hypothetical protein [Arcobacteraceae]APW65921.1 hypothetical protein LPB137_08655 [Poseidonibacter parvus]
MKIFIFTLAIATLLFALFVGFQISPIITSIFISPITYLSSFFNEIFIDLPFLAHSFLIMIASLFYLSLFIIIPRLFFKRFINYRHYK